MIQLAYLSLRRLINELRYARAFRPSQHEPSGLGNDPIVIDFMRKECPNIARYVRLFLGTRSDGPNRYFLPLHLDTASESEQGVTRGQILPTRRQLRYG